MKSMKVKVGKKSIVKTVKIPGVQRTFLKNNVKQIQSVEYR
jgi:hypothetical protein